ncbi:MAG: hypothetical protein A3G34_12545 [Candidatus Lindowbacteria bacterium RIFCSPLOWO2_12_FULL_62_27]|nr:MAG: hypothetical protein A3G34_12545 [Candidatus Lindowbacteria bacterium RIFCSPLOWO2_12_FULL_62_27]OGH63900.1 MAG: hypothetical protein A3I06_03875 [Candidatus Lindowbacteria bacterium RIFCSPLOWO2_02_FULL_62_12]
MYKRSLAIQEKSRGPDHPLVGGDLYNLGVLFTTVGRFAEAETALRRALDIFEKALGPNDSNVALTCEKIGRLYNKRGRSLEAGFYEHRATTIRNAGRR